MSAITRFSVQTLRYAHLRCRFPLQQIVLKWMDDDESASSRVSGGKPALIDARPVEGEEPSSG
jgi:hypothetical protein